LTQKGSSHRIFPRSFTSKIFGRLGLCLRVITLLYTSFALLPGCIQAQIQLIPSSSAKQSQTNETQAVSPNRSRDQAIPLSKIADRAEELDHLLREVNSQLMPKSELLESQRKVKEQATEIHRQALQTEELLADAPTPLELEDERRYWRSKSLEYGEERRRLTVRAAKLEEQIQALEAQQPEWMATWMLIRESPGIEPVIEQTKQQLEKIQTAKSQAQEHLNTLLTLQNEVSQQDRQVSDILLRVREAREWQRSRLLEPDSPPIWEARQLDLNVRLAFHRSFDRSFKAAGEFLRAHKLAAFELAGAYLLALLVLFKLKSYVADNMGTEVPAESIHVLDHPFSVALLVVLIGTVNLVASAPIAIAFLFYLLYLIPVFRLLAPLIEPGLRIFLYVLATLYVLEGVYLLVQFPSILRRGLYALLILIALIIFAWLARPSKLRQLAMRRRSQRFLVIAIRAGLVLLGVSFVANIIGFVSLGQVLGLTTLIGPFVASALYCAARVLALLLGVILRMHWALELHDPRAETIEKWGSRLFALGAIALWLKSMLRLITLYDTVVEGVSRLFKYPIGFEKIHFTLGDSLGVAFILFGGYFVARAVTLLLKKVVLPKLPLQRGLPYAISTVTYYVVLLLVALAALSGLGIELNKFTVLTGAIGVGLGFGLQNIVNNFVSGLIILFERPFHIGDTVDVGGLVGTVRRIGARSSTVVTFQGAEVIVPNSNLVSNQVINWTLSSQWRRVDVPVRVAYGTDPERVIKLLVAVAESYPGVLLERPPLAFFMGFGESALNFELRFWSARQDTWFQLQSDVTVAVAKALREAGIEIPFPQRDLHVRSVDAPLEESLAEKGIRITSSK